MIYRGFFTRPLLFLFVILLIGMPGISWVFASHLAKNGTTVRQERVIANSVRTVVLLFCQNTPSGRILLVNFVDALAKVKHPTAVQKQELATLRKAIPLYDERVAACNRLRDTTTASN